MAGRTRVDTAPSPCARDTFRHMRPVDYEQLAREILALLAARDAHASICPSEVARRVAPEAWRELMPEVREAAAALAAQGRLRITQGDQDVRPDALTGGQVRGPIRLRRRDSR